MEISISILEINPDYKAPFPLNYRLGKERVYKAKHQAMQHINRNLVSMYWDIRKIITIRQVQQQWGDSVVEIMAKDLCTEFQGKGDFSRRNIFRMRSFHMAYKDNIKVTQLVAQIGNRQSLACLW